MNFWRSVKISLRTLRRDKLFSLVNILGLSFGLISCAFVFLYVYHSFTYDQYHEHVDTIFRINSSWVGGDAKKTMAITSQPVAPYLENKYGFIEAACRISLINDNPSLTYD